MSPQASVPASLHRRRRRPALQAILKAYKLPYSSRRPKLPPIQAAAVDAQSRRRCRKPPKPSSTLSRLDQHPSKTPPPPSTTSSSHSSKTGVMLVTPGSRLSPRIPGSVPPLAGSRSRRHLRLPDIKSVVRTTAVTTRPSAPSPPSRGPSSFDLRLSAVHALLSVSWDALTQLAQSADVSLRELCVDVGARQGNYDDTPRAPVVFNAFSSLRKLNWRSYTVFDTDSASASYEDVLPRLEELQLWEAHGTFVDIVSLIKLPSLKHLTILKNVWHIGLRKLLEAHGNSLTTLVVFIDNLNGLVSTSRSNGVLDLCPNLTELTILCRDALFRYASSAFPATNMLHSATPVRALTKIKFILPVTLWAKSSTLKWNAFFADFSSQVKRITPNLQEVQLGSAPSWPTNERGMVKNPWIRIAEGLLAVGVQVSDKAGTKWRSRLSTKLPLCPMVLRKLLGAPPGSNNSSFQGLAIEPIVPNIVVDGRATLSIRLLMHWDRLLIPTEDFGKSADICNARVQTPSVRDVSQASNAWNESPMPAHLVFPFPFTAYVPRTPLDSLFPPVRLPRLADDRQKVPRHRVYRRDMAYITLPVDLPSRSVDTHPYILYQRLHPSSRAQSHRNSIQLSYAGRNTLACTQRSHSDTTPSLPSAPAAHHALPPGALSRCLPWLSTPAVQIPAFHLLLPRRHILDAAPQTLSLVVNPPYSRRPRLNPRRRPLAVFHALDVRPVSVPVYPGVIQLHSRGPAANRAANTSIARHPPG
ncbi:hypothetical protein C8F01DRAFT_1266617 [Mycena amicta]|nr:hypothetical protein C8F01DRAFT_1266617 [Mycena amicta]